MKTGKLSYYRCGQVITEQGGSENDIFFILCGMVRILVNGYEVASRQAGTHFGEMAAMDYTAKRSATVMASDDVAVLCVAQDRFLAVANTQCTVWQALARVLADRLRERTKLFRTRNQVPTVFIGSSLEGKEVANAISRACKQRLQRRVKINVWSDGVFQASKTVVEDLTTMADVCDFAILVFTPDDQTQIRGNVKLVPRDNVVYELGLFTGALGRDRSLMVVPVGIELKIPTDLLGVTMLTYKPAKTVKALEHHLDAVVDGIVGCVKNKGPR